MKHLLLTSIFLLMATIAAAANAFTGSVQGHVTDGDTGNAVAGATVTMMGDASLTCLTDSLGAYIMDGLPVGYCILQVEADGYEYSTSQAFAVSTAAPAVVDVHIRIMAYVSE